MTDRINKLRGFIEKQPEDSFLQHALGLEYVKIGEDDKARETFEKLLEQNPGYVGTYYHLGKLLERAGFTDHAISVYHRGIGVASAAGDNHAGNELRGALEDITEGL
jgi:Tfp pilus assembly protein PilF